MYRTIAVFALILGCATGPDPQVAGLKSELRTLREANRELSRKVDRNDREKSTLQTQARRGREETVLQQPAGAITQPAASKPLGSGEIRQEGKVAINPPPAVDGLVAYVGQPPQGWSSANAFSITIENVAARWIQFGVSQETYCYARVEIDGQPVTFVRPAGTGDTHVFHYPVKTPRGVESKSLLPPGQNAYLFVPQPGRHTWKAYCYEQSPQATRIVARGALASVLQAFYVTEHAIGVLQSHYARIIRLGGGNLESVERATD